MMTILLYGHLGKKFGRVHRFYVSTVSEAVRALSANYEDFKQALIDGGEYRITRGGREEVTKDTLDFPQSTKETLRIIPVVSGSGGGGIGSIIVGAFLIWATGGLAAIGGVSTGLGAGFITGSAATFIGSIGMSMVLGGVAQMLFSPPDPPSTTTRESVANVPSFGFSGAINTTSQGNAVPVCYGRMMVGSQVISAGLSVEQI